MHRLCLKTLHQCLKGPSQHGIHMTTATHQNQRINAAIDYMITDPTHSHSIEELASRAHYSPYHFLRTFRAVTKQTPMQFHLSQRLDRAARMLTYNSDIRITDVGISCGFTSSQHLSKAFKSAYGLSPRDVSGNLRFLYDRTLLPASSNTYKTFEADNFSDEPWRNKDINIIDLPDYRVGYFRTIGPYSAEILEDWFDRMVAWIGEHTPDSMMFGIPRSLPGITPHWRCVHEVCGVFEGNIKLAPGMNEQVLKGGLNAVFRTDVADGDLYLDCRRIWTWLTHCWLPSSPYQPDDRPAFEVYRRDLQGNPSNSIVFSLPVRPREDRIW